MLSKASLTFKARDTCYATEKYLIEKRQVMRKQRKLKRLHESAIAAQLNSEGHRKTREEGVPGAGIEPARLLPVPGF